MDCDFNNSELQCPHCKYVARAANWQRNCPVLRNREAVKQRVENRQGVGTELESILEKLGLEKYEGCECRSVIAKMNRHGPKWCRTRKVWIVSKLKKAKQATGWNLQLKAAAKTFTSGLIFSIDPMDPLGSLVDESIRRYEQKVQNENSEMASRGNNSPPTNEGRSPQ